MSVVMYATGDSVVAGLVPATSCRCCGRVSICEICVSADVWENAIMDFTQTAQVLHPQNRRNRREK